MLQAIRNKRFTLSKAKGFTLIELLVVIAIMGTLVTILLPNFIGSRQRSKDARRKLDVEQIVSALEQYRSVAGTYPASLTHNCDAALETLTYTDTTVTPNVTTTFLTAVPQDPGCATYKYFSSIDVANNNYAVCAYLESTTSTTAYTPLGSDSCGTGINCNYCKGPYGLR